MPTDSESLTKWVKERDAILRAWEEALFTAARDRATGEERAYLDKILEERARNGRALREPEE